MPSGICYECGILQVLGERGKVSALTELPWGKQTISEQTNIYIYIKCKMPISATTNNKVQKSYSEWWDGKGASSEWMMGSASLMNWYLNRALNKAREWQKATSGGRPFQIEGTATTKALGMEKARVFQAPVTNTSRECCYSLLLSPENTDFNLCTSHLS